MKLQERTPPSAHASDQSDGCVREQARAGGTAQFLKERWKDRKTERQRDGEGGGEGRGREQAGVQQAPRTEDVVLPARKRVVRAAAAAVSVCAVAAGRRAVRPRLVARSWARLQP